MSQMLQRYVDAGQMAGAVAAVSKVGGEVLYAAAGWQDVERRLPMRRDTLFRIASLTKPITSMAALTLFDEGRFVLEDPITDWALEFARMSVLRSPDADLSEIIPAARAITFGDLLTHRAGLTYGAFHSGPIRRAYYDALGPDIDSPHSPDAWMARLARLPLVDQPGAGFHYGVSTDLLGLIIARMEGKPLGQILQERIFAPLGMEDTSFDPPLNKRDRRAVMYGFDAQGRLERRPAHPVEDPAFLAERPAETTFESGSGGLWSTVDDYVKFARLFVDEGSEDGRRLLKASTLRRMTANCLTEEQRAAGRILGMPVFTGHGFGLGVAVVLEPRKAAVTHCKGGVGTVGWPGAFGGWWQADPTEGLVMVFMAQNALDPERLAEGYGLGVFAAIADFHALASAIPA